MAEANAEAEPGTAELPEVTATVPATVPPNSPETSPTPVAGSPAVSELVASSLGVTKSAAKQPLPPPSATKLAVRQPLPPPGATKSAVRQPLPPPSATKLAVRQPLPPPGAIKSGVRQPLPPASDDQTSDQGSIITVHADSSQDTLHELDASLLFPDGPLDVSPSPASVQLDATQTELAAVRTQLEQLPAERVKSLGGGRTWQSRAALGGSTAPRTAEESVSAATERKLRSLEAELVVKETELCRQIREERCQWLMEELLRALARTRLREMENEELRRDLGRLRELAEFTNLQIRFVQDDVSDAQHKLEDLAEIVGLKWMGSHGSYADLGKWSQGCGGFASGSDEGAEGDDERSENGVGSEDEHQSDDEQQDEDGSRGDEIAWIGDKLSEWSDHVPGGVCENGCCGKERRCDRDVGNAEGGVQVDEDLDEIAAETETEKEQRMLRWCKIARDIGIPPSEDAAEQFRASWTEEIACGLGVPWVEELPAEVVQLQTVKEKKKKDKNKKSNDVGEKDKEEGDEETIIKTAGEKKAEQKEDADREDSPADWTHLVTSCESDSCRGRGGARTTLLDGPCHRRPDGPCIRSASIEPADEENLCFY